MESTDFSELPEDIRSSVPDVLNNIPGGFFVYRAEGDEELVYINDACLRIFGCSTLQEFKDLTGFTFPGLVYPDDIEGVQRSIKEQIDKAADKMDYVEYRIVAKDGSVHWIEDFGHYVDLESGKYFFVFISEATDKIRQRMKELEDVNEQLNEAYSRERKHRKLLRAALTQANTANIAKTTFLNNMSHDVRTLLNAVAGYSNLITEHLDDKEKVTLYAERISTASEKLLDVVTETLELSRFEAGKVQLVEGECSILDVIAAASEDFLCLAERQGVDFSVETVNVEHDNVVVDEQRIEQIISQLVDNAIKYTESGGSVVLKLEELSDAPSGYARFVLSVSDSGKGMHPDFLKHMFDPFEREMNTTESGITGTGLGLTIVKHIVDLIAGHMDVSSQPGKGTTFTISFSVRVADAVSQSSKKQPSDTGKETKHILIVEDNDLNAEIAACLLEDAGFEVSCVENGMQALDLLQAEKPGTFDAILMDIQMPVMNGYEASRAIRALPNLELAEIPIIAVTSDAFPEDRKRAFDCGMDAHIAKPVNISILKSTIQQFI